MSAMIAVRSARLTALRALSNAIPASKVAYRHFASVQPGHVPIQETNEKTETNRLEKTMAKFWEKVSVGTNSDGSYAIKLDGKNIKTPLGLEMKIPQSKKSLAYLLANEWKSLPSLQIRPYLVPLTSLTARCIDLHEAQSTDDVEIKTKLGDLATIKALLLRYLDTDTMLVFAPTEDCDGELRKEQEKCYRPLIKNMEEFFTKFADDGKPISLTYLDCDKDGLIGNLQTEHTKKAVTNYLDSLSTWDLAALEKVVLVSKSFMAGVTVLRNADYNDDFVLTVEELARLVTLETVMQTARWGEVEDTHDVDKVDIKRNIASAAIVAHNSKN
jgi:ATP synthase mitochondrial F1 complex assembly factor 2